MQLIATYVTREYIYMQLYIIIIIYTRRAETPFSMKIYLKNLFYKNRICYFNSDKWNIDLRYMFRRPQEEFLLYY